LSEPNTARTVLVWAAVACALIVPVAIAAGSELLAWRQPVYIAAGFAGVIGLCLLLLQPLLAGRLLPGLSARRSARLHRSIGLALVASVIVHVAGLWITSPPDVVDALLLRSATPFSIWGVVAMWAIFGAALLAWQRRRLGLRTWRSAHMTLASVTVAGTVAHALLIEGTMGTLSKVMLCLLVLGATAMVVVPRLPRPRRSA